MRYVRLYVVPEDGDGTWKGRLWRLGEVSLFEEARVPGAAAGPASEVAAQSEDGPVVDEPHRGREPHRQGSRRALRQLAARVAQGRA